MDLAKVTRPASPRLPRYLRAVTSAASACALRARACVNAFTTLRTPTYPFHSLSLDVLSFVPAADHYVLNHPRARNLYSYEYKDYIPPTRVPCEMSDVLANDKCRRRYRVSDLAVRTPN